MKPNSNKADRRELIRNTILQNPDWTQVRLARALGLTQAAISMHIARLRCEGIEHPDGRKKKSMAETGTHPASVASN